MKIFSPLSNSRFAWPAIAPQRPEQHDLNGSTALQLADPWLMVRKSWIPIVVGFLFLVVARLSALALPIATKFLVDVIVGAGRFDQMPILAGATAIAMIVQSLAGYGASEMLSRSGQRGVAELRTAVWTHLCHLPLEFHDNGSVGSLLSRIMNDLEGVRYLVGAGLVELLGASLSIFFALVIMVKTSLLLTLVAVAFLLLFGITVRRANLKTRLIYGEQSTIRGQVTSRLTESLAAIRVTKTYCAESSECSVLRRAFMQLGMTAVRIGTVQSRTTAYSMAILGFANIFFICIGGRLIATRTLSIGDFILFVTVSNTLTGCAFQIVTSSKQLSEAIAGLHRTREVLNIQREDAAPEHKINISTLRGSIRFQNVGFRYGNGHEILENVSFTAGPGTMTAIVGSSGSGKSTIANLSAAFYLPTSGKVFIDDFDIEAVAVGSYRRHLGIVLQDSFLFDGTIQENIAFSRPGATMDEIREAAKIACVDGFVSELEEGYATMIGERGVKLSAGQRQRISVARAVLARPRILILDEATSNLDSESERVIQAALSKLIENCTAIVIAHRLSTIQHAHQILVVEEGKILERGTHESLLAARGRYFDLFKKQQMEKDVEEVSHLLRPELIRLNV